VESEERSAGHEARDEVTIYPETDKEGGIMNKEPSIRRAIHNCCNPALVTGLAEH